LDMPWNDGKAGRCRGDIGDELPSRNESHPLLRGSCWLLVAR
jgi:hypothetical protein